MCAFVVGGSDLGDGGRLSGVFEWLVLLCYLRLRVGCFGVRVSSFFLSVLSSLAACDGVLTS